MSVYHETAAEAIADATGRAFEAAENASKYGVKADPDRAVRDRIGLMREWAPAAPVADALAAIGFHPQPVDPLSLAASADPITSVAAILEHWASRPGDGVGIPAGAQPSGAVVVAVKGAPAALRAWLADAGTELRRHDNGEGLVTESREYSPCPSYGEMRWSPPPRSPMVATSFFGRDEGHELAGRVMPAREELTGAPAFLVWQSGLVWQIGETAQRLTFKSRKIAAGVEVVGSGPVPYYVRRPDGWTLTATRAPVEVDLPDWLLAELGARPVAVTA